MSKVKKRKSSLYIPPPTEKIETEDPDNEPKKRVVMTPTLKKKTKATSTPSKEPSFLAK